MALEPSGSGSPSSGSGRRLRVTVEGADPVVLDLSEDETAVLDVGSVAVRRITEASLRGRGSRRYEAVVDGWRFEVAVEDAQLAGLRERAARGAAVTGQQVGVTIRAQIPGRVVRLWVAQGETVEAGQRLLAVEAMKMENEVKAPRAGVVGAIPVEVGGTVELGDDLISLD